MCIYYTHLKTFYIFKPKRTKFMKKRIQNSSNSSTGEGNTQSPSPAKKSTQSSGRVHHAFTWNNYPSNWLELIVPTFHSFDMRKCRIQTEVGESGTPHLQGVVSLGIKCRDTEFKLPKQIHWEPVESLFHCYKYCSKLESRDTNNFVEFDWPPVPKTISVLRPWQEELYNHIKTEPDDRSIYWYYDNVGGSGKSAFCKMLAVKHPKEVLVIQGGKLADIINIIFNTDTARLTTVIIDIPRQQSNKVSFAAVECIKNGMITNTKFETGVKFFNTVHIIIFSNAEPDLHELSHDRWRVRSLRHGIAHKIEF